MRWWLIVAGLGALGLGLLLWPSGQEREDARPTIAASTSTPASSAPASADPTPTGPTSGATSEEAARTVLQTWARPDLAEQQWWQQLRPLLTADGRDLLAYTDPAQIPPLKITGPGEEDRGVPSSTATTWWFPTTEGRFGVDVARSPDGGPWLGFSIIFPGGESRRQG